MVHAKDRRRQRTRHDPVAADLKAAEMQARQRVGLIKAEARVRFGARVAAECGTYLLCWLMLLFVSAPVAHNAVDWARLPYATATVVSDPSRQNGMRLDWTDPWTGDTRHGDTGLHELVGDKVGLVVSKCSWERESTADTVVAGVVAVVVLLPAVGFIVLLVLRIRLWRRLGATGKVPLTNGYGVSLHQTRWRTFIAVDDLGQTYYVPLMRGQGLGSLHDVRLLQPLDWLERRAYLSFRVAGTDRVVWPAGACDESVRPVRRVVFTVVQVLIPLLLIPAARLIHSSVPIC